MALLPFALAGAGAVYYGADNYDRSMREIDFQKSKLSEQLPTSGWYQSSSRLYGQWAKTPIAVYPDRDLRGVQMWWVKYPDRALTQQYTPPLDYPTTY